jgi:hypothetical protein
MTVRVEVGSYKWQGKNVDNWFTLLENELQKKVGSFYENQPITFSKLFLFA